MKRVDIKRILADPDLRRELMVPTIQALQAREGIETTREQAERAYYVVNEADKAAFFRLRYLRGGKTNGDDRRRGFVEHLRNEPAGIRFDVARRDFRFIEGAPLAYDRVGIISDTFFNYPPLKTRARIHQGVITRDDPKFIRSFWEVAPNWQSRPWKPLHKGGGFCRFYFDTDLVIDWSSKSQSEMHRLRDTSLYFKEGLTWPLRTQRGVNIRHMKSGCVFSHKGGGILLEGVNLQYTLGVLNSQYVEYIALCLASFGSWEVRVLRAIPVPEQMDSHGLRIGELASAILEAKQSWDEGNETSTSFEEPWLVRDNLCSLAFPDRLDHLADLESTQEARIQQLYAELNDEVYKLYNIADATRAIIEETLGERPPEILWPQMEGKTADQKRMEHVWRLLSYVVKRVIDADEDGIVPFMAVSGETALIDRVSSELAALFPEQDINRVEVDLTNELKRKVKGYRSVQGIREWLEDVFFDYHVSLYKKRPILWHIASSQGRGACAVGALCHYHKFDRDRLAKLRGSYLRDAIALFRREAGLADQEGRTEDRQEWQVRLEEAGAFDQRLQWVQEGKNGDPAPGDCRIRTPWKSEDELPSGWQPDLDDGVAVNILPLQTAGVLRIAQVV